MLDRQELIAIYKFCHNTNKKEPLNMDDIDAICDALKEFNGEGD